MKILRREFLAAVPAMTLLPSAIRPSHALRLAVCNEIFQDQSFQGGCRLAGKSGYTGLEIAPFTLTEDPASLPPSRRREIRHVMRSEGLSYVGLHWLLAAPKGLHVTTADAAVRRRSWDYFRQLIDLCADLGEKGLMVFGSAKQRGTSGESGVREAVQRLKEGLFNMASIAEARGVTIALEPLAPHLCDVVTSLGDAVSIVKEISSPAVKAMFDTHNAVAEELPHDELIRKYFTYICHVHVNETDGRHPGTGSYDFKPVLQVLKDLSYEGWLSLEVFDFSAGPEKIARDSARFLRLLESELSAR